VAEYGLEGIVAKRRESRYAPGVRTSDWLKIHVTPRTDVVMGGLVVDERRGATTVLCGLVNDDGALSYAADARVPPYLAAWLDQATRDLATDASPFAGPLALRPGLRWLRPRLVAIVEHDTDASGTLIDPRFRALRLDARADDCRREVPVDVPASSPPSSPDRPRLVLLRSLPFT